MTTLLLTLLLSQYPSLDIQQGGSKIGRVHTWNAGTNLTCSVAKNIATCAVAGSALYPGGVCPLGQYETSDNATLGPFCAQVATSQLSGWPTCTSDQKLTAAGAAPVCSNEKWLFTGSDIYWSRNASVGHSNAPTAALDARAAAGTYAGSFQGATTGEAASATIKSYNTSTTGSAGMDVYDSSNALGATFGYGNSGTNAVKANKAYVAVANSTGLSIVTTGISPSKLWQFDSTKATFPDSTTQASAVPVADDNVAVGSGSAFAAKTLPSCSATSSALAYNNSTNTFSCNTLTGSSVGSVNTVRLASDYANSTTSFTNVSLSFAVGASTTYSFRCTLLTDTAATTTGILFDWTGPSLATSLTVKWSIPLNATAEPAPIYNNAFSTSTGTAASGSGTTRVIAKIDGILVNGVNAGTVQLQAKSGVASSAVNIRQGSYCEWF